jgi:hypothetical protein
MSRGRGKKGKQTTSNMRRPLSPLGQSDRQSHGKLPEVKKSKRKGKTTEAPGVVKNKPALTVHLPANQSALKAGDHANNMCRQKSVGQYDLQLVYPADEAMPSKFLEFQHEVKTIMDRYALQGNWRIDVSIGAVIELIVSADVIAQPNADQIKIEVDNAANKLLNNQSLANRFKRLFQ